MIKRDYFISFTKNDLAWAQWVAWELNRMHYTYYFQGNDFIPGSNFIDKMNKALKDSKQIITLWSNDYFKSRYATWELQAALASGNDEEIKIVPVLIDKCSIDNLYRPFVYINLIGKTKFESKRLLKEGLEAAKIGFVNKEIMFKNKPPKFPGERYKQDIIRDNKENKINGIVKILYLGSEAACSLDLKGQVLIIKKALAPLIKKRKVKFYTKLDLNTQNIFEILDKVNPHIIHFGGKQDGGDIIVANKLDRITTISDMQLAGLFKSLGDNLKLVIIDTCYSYSCAKHISTVINFTMGVKGDIDENEANDFYEKFYAELSLGKSLQQAVSIAETKLQFDKVRNLRIPTLFSNKKADSSKFKLL